MSVVLLLPPLVRASLKTLAIVGGPLPREDDKDRGGNGDDVQRVHCCLHWNTLGNGEPPRWGESPPFRKAFS